MLAVHGEGAVENNLFLPECETGLQLSSLGGWKRGLRAGWSWAAVRRPRTAITRGGVGGLGMRDSRIPASVVVEFWFATCNMRPPFGAARRTQNEAAWRTEKRVSYYFLLEKYVGNTAGAGAWKGSRVRQAVRIWGRLWSILAPPHSTRVTPYPRPTRSTPATRSV